MYFDLSPLRRNSLWNAPAQFEKEFEKMFDVLGSNANSLSPVCEIRDEEKQYALSLDVPGMRKEDIEIEIKDNFLHVSGERTIRSGSEKDKLLRNERRYGKFSRVFSLPQNVNADGIEARFENGVLDIILPKEEKSRAKKISISEWGKTPELQS
jgi:HSP20 family protein